MDTSPLIALSDAFLPFQSKLELITGIPTGNQRLGIYASNEDTQALAVLDDDSKALGFYGLRDWQWIKVCSFCWGMLLLRV